MLSEGNGARAILPSWPALPRGREDSKRGSFAEERREGSNAGYRVRINFENMLRLARADRPLERALATGSVPPELAICAARFNALQQGLISAAQIVGSIGERTKALLAGGFC